MIKQETRYQMMKRADMMRDEFEKYLTWKMVLRHGNAIRGVLKCTESENLIIVYRKRNVQTGEYIRSKPMAPIEAIKLMQSQKLVVPDMDKIPAVKREPKQRGIRLLPSNQPVSTPSVGVIEGVVTSPTFNQKPLLTSQPVSVHRKIWTPPISSLKREIPNLQPMPRPRKASTTTRTPFSIFSHDETHR